MKWRIAMLSNVFFNFITTTFFTNSEDKKDIVLPETLTNYEKTFS